MIIIPPKGIECSLEPIEIEIIENCIVLLKDIRNKMDEYHYSYLHTNNGDEITNGELTDSIFNLESLAHIDEMY